MAPKRKKEDVAPEGSADPPSKSAKAEGIVNPKRIRELNNGEVKSGPVIYWCVRLLLFFH